MGVPGGESWQYWFLFLFGVSWAFGHGGDFLGWFMDFSGFRDFFLPGV